MLKKILYQLSRTKERIYDLVVLIKIQLKYSDYFIFTPINSLGDSAACLVLMKEFKKRNGKKILFLINKKSVLTLIKCFQEVDDSILISDRMYRKVMRDESNNLKVGKIFSLNIYKKIGKGLRFKNMIERAKFLLNLYGDFELSNPSFNTEDEFNAENIFNSLNLKNKKVIFLSPFAVTVNDKALSEAFWSNLADSFIREGFEVVFNSDDHRFLKFKKVFLPINILVPFINKCSFVIAIRSGLTDVFASCLSIKMIVIYYYHNAWYRDGKIWYERIEPALSEDFFYDKKISFLENYVNVCSLIEMYKNKNIKEIIFNEVESDLKEKIFSESKNI